MDSYPLRVADSDSLCEESVLGSRGVAMLKLCTGAAAEADDGAVLGLTTSVPSDR